MTEVIEASEFWKRLLNRLNIPEVQNGTYSIVRGEKKLRIQVGLFRNRRIRSNRWRPYYNESNRSSEWITLEGKLMKEGQDSSIGVDIFKKVTIGRVGVGIPLNIVEKRIGQVEQVIKEIVDELKPRLEAQVIEEKKIEEFEEHLKRRYKNCKVNVYSSDRASMKFQNFTININKEEKIISISFDGKLPVWEFIVAIEDARPTMTEKRTSRLFRIHPQVEESKVRRPKNEGVRQ